jgi:enoyl-CoA hydratase/carnithine racemase
MSAMHLTHEDHGAVRVLRLQRPPVNALGRSLREALAAALRQADGDDAVRAVVLAGAGRGFCAGGDLQEFGSPDHLAPPTLALDLQPQIEGLGKPVIAALHGFAIGGGFELALACHYRVARPDTMLALPEVTHGLIPPGGSQRLPRAIGIGPALSVMLEPRRWSAVEIDDAARAFGGFALLDRCSDNDPVRQALALAASLQASWTDPMVFRGALLRQRAVPTTGAEEALARAERDVTHGHGRAARLACIEAVRVACRLRDFDAAQEQAWRLYTSLRDGKN